MAPSSPISCEVIVLSIFFFLVEGRVAPFLHISVLFTSERAFTRLSLSYINSISVYANTTCLANTRDQIEVDWYLFSQNTSDFNEQIVCSWKGCPFKKSLILLQSYRLHNSAIHTINQCFILLLMFILFWTFFLMSNSFLSSPKKTEFFHFFGNSLHVNCFDLIFFQVRTPILFLLFNQTNILQI